MQTFHIRSMEIREKLKAGSTYHICTKANGSELLFREDRDYSYFLQKMKLRLTEAWEILAYSLLPNEIHFVVRIARLEIDGEIVDHSTLLSHLLNGYVQHYNHKYDRSGSLLNRSFRRQLIAKDQELKDTICKIHNLPSIRKLVRHREEWKFSSCRRIKNYTGDKLIEQVRTLFGGKRNYEASHDSDHVKVSDLWPPTRWLKILCPLEVAFRKQHPLGVHRWCRRKRAPT